MPPCGLRPLRLLPFLIGFERFVRRKPIDFRPFVIISVAACGLVIATLEFSHRSGDPQIGIDPLRVFEGVITGIGFLGAGAMFREHDFVKGGASAASIWAAGAIGLICGAGASWLAAAIAAIIIVLLVVSGPFTQDYDTDGEH